MSQARLPKIIGADFEVGNFVHGRDGTVESCREASAALLQTIDGFPKMERRHSTTCNCVECVARWGPVYDAISTLPVYDPQDRGRRFVTAGGCHYIDSDHYEFCLPEVRSAKDFVAAKRAALLVVRRALTEANAIRTREERIVVVLKNSDGQGHSYGTHYNFHVSRRCWDNVFDRKLHYLLWLAAYQAAAMVLFGAGKAGSENGVQPAPYSLSARADFIESLMGSNTMSHRPLCNSRSEPLCGSGARSHVICFDHALADGAVFLTAGVGQIVHAMLEAGCVDTSLILDDPLDALTRWSQDSTLTASAELLRGPRVTAVELHRQYLRAARAFAADGHLDGIVPDAGDILDYWEGTLAVLAPRDLAAASRRLDWAMKLRVLEEALSERPELTWDSPEVKHLDFVYASLEESEGIFWALDGAGETERLVSDDDVARFLQGPPPDTRAWTRGELLKRAGAEVDDVDWDRIRFKMKDRHGTTRYRTVELPEPAGSTRRECEPAFRDASSLGELLACLGAAPDAPITRRYTAEGRHEGEASDEHS